MSKIKPKKSYGQHFLINRDVSHRIIEFAGVRPSDVVLEIGAGMGALTELLSRTAAHTLAIEVDPSLAVRLEGIFENRLSVSILRADFLALDLKELLKKYRTGQSLVRVVGNLPYNQATRMLQVLLDRKSLFEDMTLMVQTEVAERFNAQPNSKEYGYLANLVQYHAQVQFGFKVAPGAFHPRPKVWSSVVKLIPRPKPAFEANDYSLLMNLLKSAFAYRRKTLYNNLKKAPGFCERLTETLQAARIDPTRRAESLSLEEFVRLSNCFAKIKDEG